MTIEELGKKISPNANYTLFVDTCIEGLLKVRNGLFIAQIIFARNVKYFIASQKWYGKLNFE